MNNPTVSDIHSSVIHQFSSFVSELNCYSKQRFTGRLDIKAITGQSWSLYFNLGFLVWAKGGAHPSRRWQRQLFLCNHPARSQKIVVRAKDQFECWDYHILTLLAQRQAISEPQLIAIVRGIIQEVLFDIFLALQKHHKIATKPRLGLRPSHSKTGILRRSLTLEIAPIVQQVMAQIQQWQQYELLAYLPDLAPKILQPQRLQQKVTDSTYQKLTQILTGRKTIRDLAVLTQQNMLNLTRSLAPFIRNHLVGLVEIPDVAVPYTVRSTTLEGSLLQPETSSTYQGSILCIEDNPRDASEVEEILENARYQYHTIQDVVYALPILLQQDPDLIFLDLVMPIVSGYELCRQIRRIQKFQNTPIVILTGQDSLIDRMRAKVAGATDFISKPVEKQRLLEIIQKHCRPQS